MTDELFPSSLGSSSAASPSFREAALVGSNQEFPIHPGAATSEDEFPATGVELNTRTPANKLQRSSTTIAHSGGGSKKTVWGTPAARSGSFANALHNSSRHDEGMGEDDRPDWDSWLELEEDFIVGARNGSSMREGRGLNKQTKKSSSSVGDSSSEGGAGTSRAEEGQRRVVPGSAPPTGPGGKQQKKKKLVLTSGGGMRGR
jgi:hypothetical protein